MIGGVKTSRKIYLIRHATPDWERRDLAYHLVPGPPLTEQGRAEAIALGHFLQGAGVDQLLCSPLERCLDTARIASGIVGVDFRIDERLREWQPGESPETVRARMAETFQTEWGNMHYGSNNGIAARGVVTHGGPIGALLEWLGLEPAVLQAHRIYDHNNPLPPAAAWEIDRDGGEARWQMNLAFIPEVTLV